MKSIAVASAGFSLLMAGCSNPGDASADVSNFAAPGLAGLVVRDDPRGAVIVSETPPIGQTGAVITEVNGTRVRDAAHFHELIDRVYRQSQEFELKYEVF